MKAPHSTQRSKRAKPRRRLAMPPHAVRARSPFRLPAAIQFLNHIEALVSCELKAAAASLPVASLESERANLAHVLSHWHDDRDYVDAKGRPYRLPLRGATRSLENLIARIYPKESIQAVVQALLRSGVVRRRSRAYECISRQLVFPAGVASYVSGLLPIQGLLRTLRGNLRSATDSKLLQRSVMNARIPLREVPALYSAIDRQVRPLLESIDADMMRRELRAHDEDALAHVGLSVQVFNFRSGKKRKQRSARRQRSIKRPG